MKYRFYVKNKSFIYLDLDEIALIEQDGLRQVKLYLKGNAHPFRYSFSEAVWKDFLTVMNVICARKES